MGFRSNISIISSWLFRFLKWKPKASREKNSVTPKAPILEIPVEVIRLIADQLPIEDKIVMSQACRPFRHILLDASDQLGALKEHQKVQIMVTVAKDLPNVWVCHECLKFHPVLKDDLPAMAGSCSCPRWRFQSLNGFSRYSYQLAHRHIQTAFKLARLARTEGKYRSQLRELLKPCHYFDLEHYPLYERVLGADLSVYHRIVRGKFMVHCIWKYQQQEKPVSRETLGLLSVCRHQIFMSDYPHDSKGRPPTREGFFCGWLAINGAIKRAFEVPGVRVRGACHRCLTDFSIEASSRSAVVETWHDFGPEGTEMALNWRTLRLDDGPEAWRRSLQHYPGSVCVRYNKRS